MVLHVEIIPKLKIKLYIRKHIFQWAKKISLNEEKKKLFPILREMEQHFYEFDDGIYELKKVS